METYVGVIFERERREVLRDTSLKIPAFLRGDALFCEVQRVFVFPPTVGLSERNTRYTNEDRERERQDEESSEAPERATHLQAHDTSPRSTGRALL